MLHRDFGYFLSGMIVIYALSGIALNHRNDWNPSFTIIRKEIPTPLPKDHDQITVAALKDLFTENDLDDVYRSHDFPSVGKLKVFTKRGSLFINLDNGTGEYEALKRRPLFYQVNFLHLNPTRSWIYFSDFFCGGLILITITGLVMRKGRHGLKGRGGWLLVMGIAAPVAFLFIL